MAAVVAAALLPVSSPAMGSPAAASAPPGAPTPGAGATVSRDDLARLGAELAAATADAERLAADLQSTAARSTTLRVAMDRVAEEQDAARAALDRRVREVYMASAPDPLRALEVALAPDAVRLLAAGADGGLRVDRTLVDAVDGESAAVADLRRRSEERRAELGLEAEAVYAAQDAARELLRAAEAAWAEQERRAADERARAEAAAAQRVLAARSAALAEQSAAVASAVAPAVTARGRRAATAQEPVLALLEETQRRDPGAVPPGFRPTGQVVVGEASWYGPGFVGRPTASGAPYDPGRLTAAMTSLPLGTVVRVSRPDGLAVTVLVTDRGPYAGDRVLDLSQAAMRELGRFGVGEVRIEVLTRA